jgi:glycosyltransferase involved in cell wall biosynthesis
MTDPIAGSKDKVFRVLALIPAYNEEVRVQKVIEGAAAFLPVLVVDDGSIDQTSRVRRMRGLM